MLIAIAIASGSCVPTKRSLGTCGVGEYKYLLNKTKPWQKTARTRCLFPRPIKQNNQRKFVQQNHLRTISWEKKFFEYQQEGKNDLNIIEHQHIINHKQITTVYSCSSKKHNRFLVKIQHTSKHHLNITIIHMYIYIYQTQPLYWWLLKLLDPPTKADGLCFAAPYILKVEVTPRRSRRLVPRRNHSEGSHELPSGND